MIFAHLPLADAVGAFLVHSVQVPGQRMKKGRVLSPDDVQRLADAGHGTVLVARLEADDVAEDEAANRIAAAAQGAETRLQPAFTGRANLFAETRGLAVIDRDRIDALNLIDEAVTIATVPPYGLVEPGQMLATVKIIPFAAPASAVTEAEHIAEGDGTPLVRVAPLAAKQAGVILTRLPETKDSVLQKTEQVLADRLAGLGSAIKQVRQCAHDQGEIAEAVRQQIAEGCEPVLIFGASAITDRRDVVPAGIIDAGAEIIHFGMPVDPGNLLLLARHLDGTVVGLPGCARSPKLNGFDWVLERLCADLPIRREDIMAMGAGGLLKEIASRPQPRTGALPAEPSAAPRAPRIAALVLAAGQSRRMGAANKLLAEVDGRAMVESVVRAALASNLTRVRVVTGHQGDAVKAQLAGLDVDFTHNPHYAEGLSASLKAGLAGLGGDVDGIMVLLGDMPRITAAHIDRLIAAFNPHEGRAICVPTFNGKRGNPVLFGADLAGEMAAVAGDAGAKSLIGRHEDVVAEVAMADDAIFLDIDTPTALARVRGQSD